MDVLKVDLNAGTADTRPVVNVELWNALPEDTADYLYFDVSDHGGVGIGWTWDEGGSSFGAPAVTGLVTTQVISEAVINVEFDLTAGVTKFLLAVEGVQHAAISYRALALAFSKDGGETYGAPVAVTRSHGENTPISATVEFLRTETAQSLASSDLGVISGVPANATGLRVGVVAGGGFVDTLTAGAVKLREIA